MKNIYNLISDDANTLNENMGFQNIQKPIISQFEKINNEISQIDQKKIDDILKSRMTKMRYDRMGIAYDFMNFFLKKLKKDPKIKPIEVFKNFLPNYDNEIYSEGSACVGLTIDLYNHIPNHIKSYIIPAKLHTYVNQFGFPKLCHTAIVIPYYLNNQINQKGFILLDTSFDIPFGINLNIKKPKQKINMGQKKGIWTFELRDETKIVCYTNEDITNEDNQMIYYLEELTNPIRSSAIPMFVVDRELVVLKRDENGKHYGNIKIELDKRRIVSTAYENRKTPIEYHSLKNRNHIFDDDIYDALSFDKTRIDDMINFIVKNIFILDSLYIDYLKFLLLNKVNKNINNIRSRHIYDSTYGYDEKEQI